MMPMDMDRLVALERDVAELAIADPVALATARGGLFRGRSPVVAAASRTIATSSVVSHVAPGVHIIHSVLCDTDGTWHGVGDGGRAALASYREALAVLAIDPLVGARALWALAVAYRLVRRHRVWFRFMWRHYAPVMFERQAPHWVYHLSECDLFGVGRPRDVRTIRRPLATCQGVRLLEDLFCGAHRLARGAFRWQDAAPPAEPQRRGCVAVRPARGALGWLRSRDALRRSIARILGVDGFLQAACAIEAVASPDDAQLQLGEVRRFNESSGRLIRARLPADWHERVVRHDIVAVDRMLCVWASKPVQTPDGGTLWRCRALRLRRGMETSGPPVDGFFYRRDGLTVFARTRQGAQRRWRNLCREQARSAVFGAL